MGINFLCSKTSSNLYKIELNEKFYENLNYFFCIKQLVENFAKIHSFYYTFDNDLKFEDIRIKVCFILNFLTNFILIYPKKKKNIQKKLPEKKYILQYNKIIKSDRLKKFHEIRIIGCIIRKILQQRMKFESREKKITLTETAS